MDSWPCCACANLLLIQILETPLLDRRGTQICMQEFELKIFTKSHVPFLLLTVVPAVSTVVIVCPVTQPAALQAVVVVGGGGGGGGGGGQGKLPSQTDPTSPPKCCEVYTLLAVGPHDP